MSEKDIIEIVLDELKRRNIIREVKSSFKLTEQALYLVPKLKISIEKNKSEIAYLKKYGLPEKSKDLTSMSSTHAILDKNDLLQSRINNLLQSNIIDNAYINKVNDVLSTIKKDKYYEIIEMKYFEGKSRTQIADYFMVDEKTITKHKNRLVNEIKVLLVPNSAIDEIGF